MNTETQDKKQPKVKQPPPIIRPTDAVVLG